VPADHSRTLAYVRVTGALPDPAWTEAMRAFDDQPNVYCKVSRFMEQAAGQPAPLDVAYYAPTFDTVWRLFGSDRLVYESN